MDYEPNTTTITGAGLPPYLTRWLDLDAEARERLTAIFDTMPNSAADKQAIREFGLSFGGVTLVRKVLLRHSGRTRGRRTTSKEDQVVELFRDATSPRGARQAIQGAEGADKDGYLKLPPLSEVFDKIGATVGLSRFTVARILRDHGVWETTQRRLWSKLPDWIVPEIIARSSDELGMTQQDIADELNISVSSVRKVWREHGIIRDAPPIGSTNPGESRPRHDWEGR